MISLQIYNLFEMLGRWSYNLSLHLFSVTNGVKQGGLISAILFCVYMDDLLKELANSGLGCHMDSMFAGAFDYAEDLKLLTLSVWTLH